MPQVKREYEIDLTKPPGARWSKMIRAEKDTARHLLKTCVEESRQRVMQSSILGKVFAPFFNFTRAALAPLQKLTRCYGDFREDMEVWAKALRVHVAELVFANYQYELTQGFGCTAVAFNLPGRTGVAHVRNLDWPMSRIGPSTCLIHYNGWSGGFTSVGWPGFVGVLSGIAPGRVSATLNQAPQHRTSFMGWPVSFALRKTFEHCTDMGHAVRDLCQKSLMASAFFLVAGTKAGEAKVIEHPGKDAKCRGMRNGVVAVANHYELKEHKGINERWERECITDSRERRAFAFHKGMKGSWNGGSGASTPAKAISLLDQYPAKWEMTAQQMAFIPANGKYSVRYRDTDRARHRRPEDGDRQHRRLSAGVGRLKGVQ
jgi:hypothetical protein